MTSRFDPNFTQGVIDAIGPNVTPRYRLLFSCLIKHIHDFAREVELTNDEWLTGVRFLNSIGQASTDIRNEGRRVSDVLGLERCVVTYHPCVVESGQGTEDADLGTKKVSSTRSQTRS